MTLLSPTLPPRSTRPTLTNDAEQLRALAVRLNGRPVPGVRMTERQFVDWCGPSGLPAEWVDGEVFLMAEPSIRHADLSGWLYSLLFAFAEALALGDVYLPITMRLAVVPSRRAPDVLYIAKSRLHLLRENHLEGPPDLAVEIVSPDSAVRDWQTKRAEYAAAGVREYWIADPLTEEFAALSLHRKRYRELPIDDQGRVRSKVLKGLHVRPAWLWRTPLPPVARVLKELSVA